MRYTGNSKFSPWECTTCLAEWNTWHCQMSNEAPSTVSIFPTHELALPQPMANTHLLKSLSILGSQPPVPVPTSKQVVHHETQRRCHHEAVPNPQGVGQAPQTLTNHLGVPAKGQ